MAKVEHGKHGWKYAQETKEITNCIDRVGMTWHGSTAQSREKGEQKGWCKRVSHMEASKQEGWRCAEWGQRKGLDSKHSGSQRPRLLARVEVTVRQRVSLSA